MFSELAVEHILFKDIIVRNGGVVRDIRTGVEFRATVVINYISPTNPAIWTASKKAEIRPGKIF